MSSRHIAVAAVAAVFVAGCGSIEESDPKPRLEATGVAGTAYGDTLVGTRKQLSFQLRNSDAGLAKVKTLENIAPTITAAAGLSMTHDCPASLDQGDSCTLTVTYAPAATATLAATLRVTSNAETVSLALSGVAETPLDPAAGVLAFTATPVVDFGDVSLGNSVTRTYTVRNLGNAADTVTVALPSGSGWTATTDCPESPATLAVNATCAATVTFAPTQTGSSTASALQFSDAYNLNYGLLSLSLTGTGR